MDAEAVTGWRERKGSLLEFVLFLFPLSEHQLFVVVVASRMALSGLWPSTKLVQNRSGTKNDACKRIRKMSAQPGREEDIVLLARQGCSFWCTFFQA